MIEREVLSKAVAHYGKNSQINQLFEEMAELTQALSKNLRGANNVNCIAEEIADVEIMLNQMKIMYYCESNVQLWERFKIERLRHNLTNEGVIV